MGIWSRHHRDRLKGLWRRLRHGDSRERPYRLPQRIAAPPTRAGVALVATVKDEARHLAEWVEFHAMLGASAVYLYDNGSTDGADALIDATPWSVPVTRVPWRSFDGVGGAQRFAYAHALANFGDRHRWMAFIDVDEFLFPLIDPDLPTALSRFEAQPAVCLPWFNFGSGGHRERPPGLVIENYRERSAFPPLPGQGSLLRFKSIVDPAAVVGGGSHTFGYEGLGYAVINERGEAAAPWEIRKPGFAQSSVLRLNHYFTRSDAELAAKLAKGRVSRNGALVADAYRRRLRAYGVGVERDDPIQRFAPALKARLAGLAPADPP